MASNTLTDSARPGAADRLLKRLLASRTGRLAYRCRRLLPFASFALGVGSYFLVQRQAQLAQWLTALMLVGWAVLLFEGLLCHLLARYFGERLPQVAVRFAAQWLHQETLFFVLPFFLATTTWHSGQALFTGLLVIAAVASTIDPLYLEGVAGRRWLFLGFHAFTLFAAILAAGPIMLSLTTGRSIELAAAAMGICALPSFSDVLRVRHWSRWFLLAGLSLALGLFSWSARLWIPPATLHATDIVISTQMNTARRTPGPGRDHFNAAAIVDNGLYAFSAIKAPRGLHQKVLHVWSHNGKVVSRIPLQIRGGSRKAGFRTWSHRTTLGSHPAGRWQVAVVTDDGQLIGARRFTIAPRAR